MRVSTRRFRCGRYLGPTVLVAAVIAIDAHAELVGIRWDNAGRFETAVSVVPGKFAEVCGQLDKGQSVAWSFKADRPMNFNIHYHEGKQVVFPAKQDAVVDAQGKLDVSLSQDYCWMWTNKTDLPAQLRIVPRR